MGNDLVERRIAYCLKQAEAEASVLTMWNEKEYPNSPQKPVLIEQTQAYITAEMLKSQAARIEALEEALKDAQGVLMTSHEAMVERVARAICQEECAGMGEPACWQVDGQWPNPNCDKCHALARAALSAINKTGGE